MKVKNDTLLKYLQYGDKVPDDQTILDSWNNFFAGYKGIRTHKSLDSKVLEITNIITGESYWKTLRSVINEVFMAGYTLQQILDSISNYHKVITSEGFFYNKKWSLAEFLYKGITEKKGFVHFLNDKRPLDFFKKNDYINPEIERMESLGKAFRPLTKKYDPQCIYDMNMKTYFGFSLSELKNVKIRKKDLDKHISNNNEVSFSYFCELELIIAHVLLNRKKKPDFSSLARYMVLWNKEKERFK